MALCTQSFEFLKLMLDKHWLEIHHQEVQRTQIAAFGATVAGAVLLLLSTRSLDDDPARWLFAGLFLAGLGAIGVLATAKFTERQHFAQNRLEAMYKRLDAEIPSLQYLPLRTTADEKYYSDRMETTFASSVLVAPSRRIGLAWIWIGMHALLLVTGLTFSALAYGKLI